MFLKRKKKYEPTEEEKRWNKLWDMYADGELDDISHEIYCLCDYEGGVNGEGHSGYFSNNEDDLADIIGTLSKILPKNHCDNLMSAYKSYNTDDEDEICDKADDFFYDNEQEVLDILHEFVNGLTL